MVMMMMTNGDDDGDGEVTDVLCRELEGLTICPVCWCCLLTAALATLNS